MTRPLHKDTRVQRGKPAEPGMSALAFGHEPGDAPPAKVAYVLAAFMSLMPVGLGTAGLVASSWSNHHPSAAAASHADRQPPAPPLLADPTRARLRIEAGARRRLRAGPVTIDAAMARVARRGWDGAGAPSTAQVARDHAEARR